MFIDFFLVLRRRGVPVTLNEWLLLQEALSVDLMEGSLTRFYHLARAILVKTEAHFDKYDRAFLECFGHIESDSDLIAAIEAAMKDLPPIELSEEEKQMVEQLSLGEVAANFLEQLRKQDSRRHEGGNRAIGLRGRSTQGARGFNPAGVRVGQTAGRLGRAIQIAGKRDFENYRDDVGLDVRSMKIALSYLRQIVREGPRDELDIGQTIDATCRNAGELSLVWDRKRKKKIKLVLLMDAGGTMSPYAELVSRLFSAARDVVKGLKSYYFHNCIYEDLYTDIFRGKTIETRKVIEQTDRSYKVVVVGDASMAPSELFASHGAIDFWHRNERPGIEWLTEIRSHFPKAIWLNPEPKRWWSSVPTTAAIGRLFPMYELTLSGLRAGARSLLR
jgi:uncharacterized protein with von Willebrand factor type A (vWA) domain